MRWWVAVCSLVFAIGTAVQNFVVIDHDLVARAAFLAGAPLSGGFLTGLRLVGDVYLVGNLLGLLVLTGRRWVFWPVLAVNATQAAGVFAIPPSVWRATVDLYGWPGLLPSLVTDGGALVLTFVLLWWRFSPSSRTPPPRAPGTAAGTRTAARSAGSTPPPPGTAGSAGGSAPSASPTARPGPSTNPATGR